MILSFQHYWLTVSFREWCVKERRIHIDSNLLISLFEATYDKLLTKIQSGMLPLLSPERITTASVPLLLHNEKWLLLYNEF